MPLVELHDVVKRYGTNTVLDGVSLSVEKGEIIAIIGRSGSGKSTMLRCVNGLEPIQQGRIVFDGEVVNDPATDLRKLRQRVGIVFQSYNLFPHLSVLDNVALAPRLVGRLPAAQARRRAGELLERVGLSSFTAARPGTLSGGQQQRVAIARALAMQPRVMLFDEPTSALDPGMTREVLDVIVGLAQAGQTMVVVTHDHDFAKRAASWVVELAEGRVARQGTADQLL